MTEGHPERARLQKGDADLIKQALEAQGFRVYKAENRVEGYDGERYVCGFYWHTATKEQPAGWRFDLALAYAYSIKDLKTAITEARRVRKLRPRCMELWRKFSGSKSDKRWATYRGAVAALFLRQESEEE